MAIDFPNSPSVNDTYTVDDKTFLWTGDYWRVLNSPNYISTLIKDADNDTKIEVEQSADEDTVRITTAGTERYSIGSAGHIIPTANETYDLGSSSNRFRDIYLSGSSINLGGVAITSDGTSLSMPPVSNISGDFTVDTDTLHVDSTNDRVGIGTTSPTSSLEVHTDFPKLTLTNDDQLVSADAYFAGIEMRDSSENFAGAIGFISGEDQDMRITSYRAGADLHLVTGGANNERVTITDTGNVGIGTTSPAYTLDVDGDINMRTGHSFYYDVAGATSVNPVFWIDAENIDVDLMRVGTDQFSTSADYGMTLRYRGSGVGNGNAFDILMDNQAGTQLTAMTFLQDGNVGIGDSTPSYKLDVNGDINAQGYARSKGKKLGMALIYEGSLSGTTSTFLGTFSADWLNYRIVIDAAQNGNGGWTYFRFVDSTNNSIQSGYYTGFFLNGSYNTQAGQGGAVAIYSEYYAYGGMIMDITLPYQGDHPSFHISSAGHNVNGNAIHSLFANGYCATTSDITGFQFYNGAPYGAVKVYGY